MTLSITFHVLCSFCADVLFQCKITPASRHTHDENFNIKIPLDHLGRHAFVKQTGEGAHTLKTADVRHVATLYSKMWSPDMAKVQSCTCSSVWYLILKVERK